MKHKQKRWKRKHGKRIRGKEQKEETEEKKHTKKADGEHYGKLNNRNLVHTVQYGT